MNWGNAWKEIKGVKVCREGWKQKVLLILLVFQIVQSVHSDCTKIWRFVLCETGSAHPPLPLSHHTFPWSRYIFSLYKNLKVVLCVTGSAHVPYPPLSYHTFPPPLKTKIFCPSNCYNLFKVFAGNIINWHPYYSESEVECLILIKLSSNLKWLNWNTIFFPFNQIFYRYS